MTTFDTNNAVEAAQDGRIEPVAAYVRVSHQEQKMHGISLEAQVQKLEEYAAARNMENVAWYKDEGISGRKLIKKRPALQRMIQDAQSGNFRRIIFIKLDRYFRSVAEFHECQKLLDEVGVTWTATEEKYDMASANGRAFVNMKLTIAELEADQGGERVKIVNEYKIKAGLPLFGDQSMPFCYGVGQPEPGERHKYVVKRNQEIMEDLIAHVMVNHSVRGALGYINNKYDASFGYNAVMNALRNPMLYGFYKGNPNYCPPYLTKEMFDKLQAIVKRNPRSSDNEYTYIFTGLIRCPECGTRLGGTMHMNKKNGKTYIYRSYRCTNNRLHHRCSFNKSVMEKRMETLLLDNLEDIIAGQKVKSVELREKHDRVKKYNLPELQAELERLNYSWQKGRIKSAEEYDKKYDAVMEKINAAHAEHDELTAEPDYEKIQAVLTADWKEIYTNLDLEHKRAFWRSFIDEIHVNWTTKKKEITDVIFF